LNGLLVDYGGVLTLNVFDSFTAFCEAEGLDTTAFVELLRSDPEARRQLRRVETGELGEDEVAERLGRMLGVEDHRATTARRSPSCSTPWSSRGTRGSTSPSPRSTGWAPSAPVFEPEDCVFVDDLRENCEGAEAVGMTAVLHRGAERTLPRLEELLGVELRQPD
jgi:putative hydrolase of the HAD superfamily